MDSRLKRRKIVFDPFASIPDDIVLYIFEFLKQFSKLEKDTVRITCKRFNRCMHRVHKTKIKIGNLREFTRYIYLIQATTNAY